MTKLKQGFIGLVILVVVLFIHFVSVAGEKNARMAFHEYSAAHQMNDADYTWTKWAGGFGTSYVEFRVPGALMMYRVTVPWFGGAKAAKVEEMPAPEH